MTPADVLDAAANLIERDGWWNGGDFTVPPFGRAPRCAATAIWAVSRNSACRWNAEGALLKHISPAYNSIPVWNDAQDGPDKVVWTMRQVASDLRAADG